MGKCIECGVETPHKYAISANKKISRQNYRQGNQIIEETKYRRQEVVEDYACSMCVLKKGVKINIFTTIFYAFLVYLMALFIVIVFFILSNITSILLLHLLSGLILLLCIGIIYYRAKKDKGAFFYGSELIAEYHRDELLKRNPGCELFFIRDGKQVW